MFTQRLLNKLQSKLRLPLSKRYCALWLTQASSLFPLAKELSPWSKTNLSTVLPVPSHSLIGLSVLPWSLTSVCFSVFPCRLWAAVSAGSGEALPISADGEPELQHPGGRRRGPAKPQRWTVDRESRAGEGTTRRLCVLSDFYFFFVTYILDFCNFCPRHWPTSRRCFVSDWSENIDLLF